MSLDGAVPSIALGKDPEAILLLEARKSAAGEAWEWQYAVARFYFDGVIVRHMEAVVDHVERDDTEIVMKLGDPPSRDQDLRHRPRRMRPAAAADRSLSFSQVDALSISAIPDRGRFAGRDCIV